MTPFIRPHLAKELKSLHVQCAKIAERAAEGFSDRKDLELHKKYMERINQIILGN